MKIIAIIQARMGATRLPGKMLMDIAGKPAVAWSIERAAMADSINEVWMATTVNPADDAFEAWAHEHSVNIYRGSEQDVLDRYYQTAREAEADIIVRITADCPFTDPQVVDAVIQANQDGSYDYVSNVHPPTYPDGLDVEVFSFSALDRVHKEARLQSEREHVTPYIWKHPELFKLKNVTNNIDLSSYRWTLDTPEDLTFLQHVGEACIAKGGNCGMGDILGILSAHPDWRALNNQYKRNEGYVKSLQEDKKVVE